MYWQLADVQMFVAFSIPLSNNDLTLPQLPWKKNTESKFERWLSSFTNYTNEPNEHTLSQAAPGFQQ